jgi:hypothetical protein
MRATSGAEKRQAPRMPVEWPVRARVMGQNEGMTGLRSFNVSKGGLGLELPEPLERDTVLKLEFAPGDGEAEVHAYAFVAWSTAQGQVGLRFFGIGEDDENRLAGIVERFLLGRPRMTTVH